jgi:hypothetical protein
MMVHTPENDVAFMRDPDRWPNWPVLPVVERSGNRRPGIMTEQAIGSKPRVWVGAIMWKLKKGDLVEQLEQMAEFKEYESFEALALEWRVD